MVDAYFDIAVFCPLIKAAPLFAEKTVLPPGNNLITVGCGKIEFFVVLFPEFYLPGILALGRIGGILGFGTLDLCGGLVLGGHRLCWFGGEFDGFCITLILFIIRAPCLLYIGILYRLAIETQATHDKR